MAIKQIIKNTGRLGVVVRNNHPVGTIHKPEDKKTVEKEENNIPKRNRKMKNDLTKDQIEKVQELLDNTGAVKIVKKDKGLIERTESSKIVLTEDNRQVLND